MSGKRGPRIPKPLQSVHRDKHISQADMHVTVLSTHFCCVHAVPTGIHIAQHLPFLLYGEKYIYTGQYPLQHPLPLIGAPPLKTMKAFKWRLSSIVSSVLSARDVNSNTGQQTGGKTADNNGRLQFCKLEWNQYIH